MTQSALNPFKKSKAPSVSAAASQLEKDQLALENQQQAELDQQKKKLQQQQLAILKSRFGASGAATGGAQTAALQGQSDTGGSLFSRITGN